MGTVSWLTNKKEQLDSSCSVAKKRRTRFRFGEYNFINTLKDVTLSPEVAETSLCVSVSSVCVASHSWVSVLLSHYTLSSI